MDQQIALVQLLLARLERISADSHMAHRASGVRGALLRALEKPIEGRSAPGGDMTRLLDLGFAILQRAAEDRIK
jgi:hypothetical protein